MGKVILFPTHKDYCNKCIYHFELYDSCLSEDYQKNSYYVNYVWGYCKYKKVRTNKTTEM